VKVRVEKLGQITIVNAEGRLDFGAAANFQLQVEQALAAAGAAPAALIIDCTGLEYVSSAGLRVFLLAARNAQRSGLGFAVCSLHQGVREVFELSGFSRVMTVHPDRATALAQLAVVKPA
jgi:anti-anti-sigma factor